MIHLYLTRADWLAARADRIGASEVHTLLNHPAEFLHRRANPLVDNKDLRRGRLLEPTVALLYTDETGRECIHPGTHYGGGPDSLVVETHDVYTFAAQSPDFYIGNNGQMEAKTQRSRREWADEDIELSEIADLVSGIAPVRMITQAYWQLAVGGREWVDLVGLLPNYDLRIIRINADTEFQADLLEMAADARDRYLIRGEIPPPDASRAYAAELLRRTPNLTKQVRRATAAEVALIDRCSEAQAREAAAKDDAATLRNQILTCIGADYGIQGAGRRAPGDSSAGP